LIKPLTVSFTHYRTSGQDEIASYLGCEPIWGAERNLIRFKPQDLNLGIKTADTGLLGILIGNAEDALKAMAEQAPGALEDVREAIVKQAAQGRPTGEAVAAVLGISGRTLSRRLADAGTDFRTLLDETREALAREYLASGEVNIRDVAYLLGFSDPSSFSAACRRWTGQTPSELQQSLKT
jgi:AraC-like DNA-binding protein